jgi:hypothetical protein
VPESRNPSSKRRALRLDIAARRPPCLSFCQSFVLAPFVSFSSPEASACSTWRSSNFPMGHAKPTALERALHGKRTSMKPRR